MELFVHFQFIPDLCNLSNLFSRICKKVKQNVQKSRTFFLILGKNAERKKASIKINGHMNRKKLFLGKAHFSSFCPVEEQEITHTCFTPGGSSISLSDDGSLIPHRDINITDQSTA